MAHFAELDNNNIVLRVLDSDHIPLEILLIAVKVLIDPQEWKCILDK
jgi:hypothetical protein